jgi:ribosomal protein S18 acetylase RimI-like enzyme
MTDIHIRQWATSDIPCIREITWTTWLDTYGSFIPEEDMRGYYEEQYDAAALEDLMRRPGVEGCVAEVTGEAAGYLKTHDESSEGRFYVSSVYVLPRFQGVGVGSRLMGAAEERARVLGRPALWLGVMVQNLRALAWYRKQGFTFVEELPFTMGTTTVNHLIGFKPVFALPGPTS